MADINFSSPPLTQSRAAKRAPGPVGDLRWDIIELLFFAYRDFVGDADHRWRLSGSTGRITG
jgi:hypothetical protein